MADNAVNIDIRRILNFFISLKKIKKRHLQIYNFFLNKKVRRQK